MNLFVDTHAFPFLLGKHLRVELLGQMISGCLTSTEPFPKGVTFCIPTDNV